MALVLQARAMMRALRIIETLVMTQGQAGPVKQ